MEEEILHRTASVCPVCLKRIAAERVRVGKRVFLRKTCPVHGTFQTLIWRGRLDPDAWLDGAGDASPGDGNPSCPSACGLCPQHLRETCCTLLEVTHRCNLACRFCFAGGGREADPGFDEIKARLVRLTDPGKTLVQLSGGEPTLRNDLPEIVAAAKEAGCRFVQLNTNGLRLAEDKGFVEALAAAGLSFVFLQFDGTDDAIYETLRGRPLFRTKRLAIANCAARNIGVSLVPTLVPGVNTGNIGGILRFGLAQSPAVRGIHFQPVSYFGRIPSAPTDDRRFLLDELLTEIERQTDGMIRVGHFKPSHCDHPLCGFHGDFLIAPHGRIVPLAPRSEAGAECCGKPMTAEQNREYIGRRWQRPPAETDASDCGVDLRDMDVFLSRVRSHGFTITAMAFQDAGNLDLERLRRCSLHVFDDGRFVPFCAYYLSGWGR